MQLFYIKNLDTGETEHDTAFTTQALAEKYATERMGMTFGKFGYLLDENGDRAAKVRTLRLHVE